MSRDYGDATPVMLEVAKLNFDQPGDHKTPKNWSLHLRTLSGRVNKGAIELLGEIVYWYRPRVVYDPDIRDGHRWTKAFAGDKLQLCNKTLATRHDMSESSVRRHLDYLERYGFITMELRTIHDREGRPMPNQPFIEPVAARLQEITNTVITAEEGCRRIVELEARLQQAIQPTVGEGWSQFDTRVVSNCDLHVHGTESVPDCTESTPEIRTRDSAPQHPEPADAGPDGLPLEERKPLSRSSSKPAFTAKLGSPKPLGTAIKVKNRSLSMRARLQRTQDPVGPKPAGGDRPVWSASPGGGRAANGKANGKKALLVQVEQALPLLESWEEHYVGHRNRHRLGPAERDPNYRSIQQRWMNGFCRLLGRGESPGTVTAALNYAFDSLCYPVDRPWSFFAKYDLIASRRAAGWGWLDRKRYMESPEAKQENEEYARHRERLFAGDPNLPSQAEALAMESPEEKEANKKYYEWLFSGEHDPNAPSQPMFPWR